MPLSRYIAAAALAAVTAPALAHQPTIRYEVVDLGVTESHSAVCPCFFTQAGSSAGAAGFFFGTDGTYNAFVYRDGAMIDISPPGDNRTFSRAINEQGWAVGWTNAFGIQHAYLHDGETHFVRELDLDQKVAFVERRAVDYYTQPITEQKVKLDQGLECVGVTPAGAEEQRRRVRVA